MVMLYQWSNSFIEVALHITFAVFGVLQDSQRGPDLSRVYLYVNYIDLYHVRSRSRRREGRKL